MLVEGNVIVGICRLAAVWFSNWVNPVQTWTGPKVQVQVQGSPRTEPFLRFRSKMSGEPDWGLNLVWTSIIHEQSTDPSIVIKYILQVRIRICYQCYKNWQCLNRINEAPNKHALKKKMSCPTLSPIEPLIEPLTVAPWPNVNMTRSTHPLSWLSHGCPSPANICEE